MGLIARHLEQVGIPTVIAGSAKDIVEECGVARYVFTDFPLGNPLGKPYDIAMQSAIVGTALDLLTQAWMPRTTVQTPFVWDENNNDGWREHFMAVTDENQASLAAAGEARRQRQAQNKGASRVRAN